MLATMLAAMLLSRVKAAAGWVVRGLWGSIVISCVIHRSWCDVGDSFELVELGLQDAGPQRARFRHRSALVHHIRQ